MRRLVLVLASLITSIAPAVAETRGPDFEALLEALSLRETIEIMREEGLQYGHNLEADLFPGRGGARWSGIVETIYDPAAMAAQVTDAMAESLPDEAIPPLLAFFTSETGARIIALEIDARRALLDDDIDAFSREALAKMIESENPRLDLIRTYSDANSLVEENVVGALNSNYAFYLGLQEGGAFPIEMTESDILADVWSQEPDIRSETEEWVLSYLSMAYEPLSDDELQSYIDLSQTPEGQALNRALFDGFDSIFVSISRALGLASSKFLVGEDI